MSDDTLTDLLEVFRDTIEEHLTADDPHGTLSADLRELRDRKAAHALANGIKKDLEGAFKRYQSHTFDRMEAEETESQRVDGTTFSPTEQTFAQVQDRRMFIEWELGRWRDDLAESVLGVPGFADDPDLAGEVADAVIRWTMERPELIEWREVGDVCNALVRQRLDDEEPLPPGMGARPNRYISVRNA